VTQWLKCNRSTALITTNIQLLSGAYRRIAKTRLRVNRRAERLSRNILRSRY